MLGFCVADGELLGDCDGGMLPGRTYLGEVRLGESAGLAWMMGSASGANSSDRCILTTSTPSSSVEKLKTLPLLRSVMVAVMNPLWSRIIWSALPSEATPYQYVRGSLAGWTADRWPWTLKTPNFEPGWLERTRVNFFLPTFSLSPDRKRLRGLPSFSPSLSLSLPLSSPAGPSLLLPMSNMSPPDPEPAFVATAKTSSITMESSLSHWAGRLFIRTIATSVWESSSRRALPLVAAPSLVGVPFPCLALSVALLMNSPVIARLHSREVAKERGMRKP